MTMSDERVVIDPNLSVYFDMYRWGLKRIPLETIEEACKIAGKILRKKDVDNYWRGYYKSNARSERDIFSLDRTGYAETIDKLDLEFSTWPTHPYIHQPEIESRWVPCNEHNKPMIKWSQGCMSLVDAQSWPHCVYIAENLLHTRFIVLDCDGDHDPSHLDMETIMFLSKYKDMTHTMIKPKMIWEYDGYEGTGLEQPASFHLTFVTDRVIPTIHCQEAHIDILGNQNNQLRYYKKKLWNGLEPIMLTEEIWDDVRRYCKYRKEDYARRNESLGVHSERRQA